MFKKKSLLAAGMALILAACGQGGESSEESSSNPDAKEVTVAVENSSKPLSFTDDSGELTGYEVETIKALDEGIKELKENGRLKELSEKWYEEDMFQYEITES